MGQQLALFFLHSSHTLKHATDHFVNGFMHELMDLFPEACTNGENDENHIFPHQPCILIPLQKDNQGFLTIWLTYLVFRCFQRSFSQETQHTQSIDCVIGSDLTFQGELLSPVEMRQILFDRFRRFAIRATNQVRELMEDRQPLTVPHDSVIHWRIEELRNEMVFCQRNCALAESEIYNMESQQGNVPSQQRDARLKILQTRLAHFHHKIGLMCSDLGYFPNQVYKKEKRQMLWRIAEDHGRVNPEFI